MLSRELKPGDEVQFWQTVNGAPALRSGKFVGINPFNGRFMVVTGQGLDAYTHYLKPEKIIVHSQQEELPF